jgi:GTP cyclohydrolase I
VKKKKEEMENDGLKEGLNDMVIENMMDDYAIEIGYHRRDTYNPKTLVKLGNHYKEILRLIGEDPTREGLLKTPERVAKAMQFLTHGYDVNPEEMLRSAMFKEDYKQMVIVKDIEIYSLCEHHMIPFFGKAHVAYIPNGYIVGLSKIPRVVDAFARRLQVQERLTTQIKEVINNTLKPLGVAVVIEAQHMCMSMRGIQKQNSVTTTSDFTGAFLVDKTRAEFIHLIGSKLH